ncbi:hypothetical protein A4R44_03512 [Amycolatopsis sp. M39]|uniref:Uncharacterized protein n=1 Tax=Amycolatopsis rubida TaxID=112413 RepID=A0A1I5ZBC7_9PSEU|nr:hypothetical protein A4R44_03512 [Amycolatopsis sp. M39]SFQ53799.1 hypothetical protein SAMN05421854_114174 [Amycolatopsis rubida]
MLSPEIRVTAASWGRLLTMTATRMSFPVPVVVSVFWAR